MNITNNAPYCIDTKPVLLRFGAVLTMAARATGLWFVLAITSAFNVLVAWQTRATQRRQLADQSAHILRDMGMTRGDAIRESGKPFWRV
jgi:uncharacterized protein YjiS (DUF1127 family)